MSDPGPSDRGTTDNPALQEYLWTHAFAELSVLPVCLAARGLIDFLLLGSLLFVAAQRNRKKVTQLGLPERGA
jgi:hypothetical protein